MNRIRWNFVTAVFLAVSVFFGLGFSAPKAVYAAQERVFDNAGLLTEEQKEVLENNVKELKSKTEMDVVVVTTDDAEGKTAQSYAENFYVDGEYGAGKDYSGILFLIDMDNREIYLSPVGMMNRYLTDTRQDQILDAAYEEISDGDYMACIQTVLDGVDRFYEAGIPKGQRNVDELTGNVSVYRRITWIEALVALAAALGVAGIAVFRVLGQYSMKTERAQSANYLMAYKADSAFRFGESTDRFVNKTVTHMIIPRNTGNGGGSSSGTTTTHSSSGRTFGGRGRKF